MSIVGFDKQLKNTAQRIPKKEETSQGNQIQSVVLKESIKSVASGILGKRKKAELIETCPPLKNITKAPFLASSEFQIGLSSNVLNEVKEVKGIINEFCELNKNLYLKDRQENIVLQSNETILEATKQWLCSAKRKISGSKPRLEFRIFQDGQKNFIVNIALIFPNGQERDLGFSAILKKNDLKNSKIALVSAGNTTLEIGNKGVNKATSIDYLIKHLSEIAKQSKYTKGSHIDALKHSSFLCLDADGTLWGNPEKGKSPEANNLANSPAKESILSYLRLGGILVINSGNDPQRTLNRLLLGIPENEKSKLLPRIFISASGGHILLTIDENGKGNMVEDYQKNGITSQNKEMSVKNDEITSKADFIYIGDDPRRSGNDYLAYEKAGNNRAICVTNKEEQVEGFEDIVVKGEMKAVNNIVNQVINRVKLNPEKPLFSDVVSLRKTAKSIMDPKKIDKN